MQDIVDTNIHGKNTTRFAQLENLWANDVMTPISRQHKGWRHASRGQVRGGETGPLESWEEGGEGVAKGGCPSNCRWRHVGWTEENSKYWEIERPSGRMSRPRQRASCELDDTCPHSREGITATPCITVFTVLAVYQHGLGRGRGLGFLWVIGPFCVHSEICP